MANRDLSLRRQSGRVKSDIRKLEKEKSAFKSSSAQYQAQSQAFSRKQAAFESKYSKYTSGVRGSKIFQSRRQESPRVVKKAFKEYSAAGKELIKEKKEFAKQRLELLSAKASIQQKQADIRERSDVLFKKQVKEARLQVERTGVSDDGKIYVSDPFKQQTREATPTEYLKFKFEEVRAKEPERLYTPKGLPPSSISLAEPPTTAQKLRQDYPTYRETERAGKEIYGLGKETAFGAYELVKDPAGSFKTAGSDIKALATEPETRAAVRESLFTKPYATAAAVPLFVWGGRGVGKPFTRGIGYLRKPASIAFRGAYNPITKVTTGALQVTTKGQKLAQKYQLGIPKLKEYGFKAKQTGEVGEITAEVGLVKTSPMAGNRIIGGSRSITAKVRQTESISDYESFVQAIPKGSKKPAYYRARSSILESDETSFIVGNIRRIKAKKKRLSLERDRVKFAGRIDTIQDIPVSYITGKAVQATKAKPITAAKSVKLATELTRAATPAPTKVFVPLQTKIVSSRPAPMFQQQKTAQLQMQAAKQLQMQVQATKQVQMLGTKQIFRTKQMQATKQVSMQAQATQQIQMLGTKQILKQKQKTRQRQATSGKGFYKAPPKAPPRIIIPVAIPLPKRYGQRRTRSILPSYRKAGRRFGYAPSIAALSLRPVRGKAPRRSTGLEIRRVLRK